MSEITEKIREELLKRCNTYKEKTGYDFWEEHIQYVVKNAIELAQKYHANIEIVELGALLHDIAMPSEYGPRKEHHIYGEKIAEELLTNLNYPKDKKELVKKCVLNHRASTDLKRETIEEECVADADAIAHFDCIPCLFSLAFKTNNLSIKDATEFVKQKLEKDYKKLSHKSKELLKDRYQNIMKVLFVK